MRQWSAAQFSQLELSATDRECVILMTGVGCQSAYERHQHIPLAKAIGFSQDELDAIQTKGTTPGFFDSDEAKGIFGEKERVLLGWIAAVGRGPEVSDEVMEEVKKVVISVFLTPSSKLIDPSISI